MSIDLNETVKEAIQGWLKDELPEDCPVFEANPNVERPDPPFVTWDMLTFGKIGTDSRRHQRESDPSAPDNEFQLGGQRMMTLSIKTFGENAEQFALDIQTSTEKISAQETMRAGGLAFWNEPQIIDISSELNTGIERRSQIDVFLGFASNVIETLDIIESAEISGTIKDENGNIVVTVDETIP